MLDFDKLTHGNTRYNFHSHTLYCDGQGTLSQYAQAAVDAGFTHYGFSPHAPINIPSPCNMLRKNVDTYLAEANAVKKQFGDRLHIYTAMEIDWLDADNGPAAHYWQSLPLDYRIGSVHFVPSRTHAGEYHDIDGSPERFRNVVDTHFDGDVRHVVESFYSQSIKMVRQGGFDIIGHFDKVGHNASAYQPGIENTDWYIRASDELADAIIATPGLVVELNTKAYERCGRLFPSTRLLQRVLAAKATVIVNSDAHHPTRINSGREAGLLLLDKLKNAPRN